jgi:transposase InsO family protein
VVPRSGIQARFGALGRKGAIAVIERFFLSLKNEALRRLLVPMSLEAMRSEATVYMNWYNTHRPHQALRGCTPLEVADALAPARDGPRFEPRSAVKVEAHDLRAEPGAALECVVDFQQGRRHLPVVTLREAA